MFRRLRDVPDCLGNFDGVDYEADIKVRITTYPKLRRDVENMLNGVEGFEKVDTVSLDKEYQVIKITSYGDPFDVTIINDKGEEERFGEWFFEDVDVPEHKKTYAIKVFDKSKSGYGKGLQEGWFTNTYKHCGGTYVASTQHHNEYLKVKTFKTLKGAENYKTKLADRFFFDWIFEVSDYIEYYDLRRD